MKKPHTYLTPDILRQLKPGETYSLGYDDFNRNKFGWKLKSMIVNPTSHSGVRQECVGTHVDPDCSDTWDHPFYQYNGPHRDGSIGPVMCSGSGCERIFFTKIPKNIKL